MSNILHFPLKMTTKKPEALTSLQYDPALNELRHRLTMAFLKQMQEQHSAQDVQVIIDLNRNGNLITKAADIKALEHIVLQLENFGKRKNPARRKIH